MTNDKEMPYKCSRVPGVVALVLTPIDAVELLAEFDPSVTASDLISADLDDCLTATDLVRLVRSP